MSVVKSKVELKSSSRQLATVIDLNKCMGCQTCTVACKNIWTRREGTEHMRWASVSTTPGPGYPRDWQEKGGGYGETGEMIPGKLTSMIDCGDNLQFNNEEVFAENNGKQVRLIASTGSGQKPEWGYNWNEEQASGEWPNPYYFYLPKKCNHCSNAPCIDACSRNAIAKREDGIVLIDQAKCTGHRHCIEACPYKMIYFNPVSKKSEKCIDCFPRVDQKIAPACNRQCVGRTRAYGHLDDENSQVYKLVKKWKVALPLHPEYGTEPNVYYVPPWSAFAFDEMGRLTDTMRLPLEVLEGYFGPNVKATLDVLIAEREKRKRGEKSEIMELLISKKWSDRFAEFTAEPA